MGASSDEREPAMNDRDTWLARLDWGHALVVLGMAAGIVVYLIDAFQASSKVGNLILILPASILGLILCLLMAVSIWRQASNRGSPSAPPAVREPLSERLRPLVLLGLFTLYVLLLPLLGLDIGSLLFLILALIANGERRPVFIVLYSLVFAAVVTLLFKSILPYPMPTRLL